MTISIFLLKRLSVFRWFLAYYYWKNKGNSFIYFLIISYLLLYISFFSTILSTNFVAFYNNFESISKATILYGNSLIAIYTATFPWPHPTSSTTLFVNNSEGSKATLWSWSYEFYRLRYGKLGWKFPRRCIPLYFWGVICRCSLILYS